MKYCLSCLLSLLSVPACGGEGSDAPGELGAPCNDDLDCADDLACDVHDGRGSCQTPHPH